MPPKPPPALSELAAHAVELLSCLGPVRARRMFGGHGFDVDGVFLALSIGDQLYLKADVQTAPRFRDAGCQPFTYDAKGRERVTLSYWTVPDDAMESPALMRPWARLAMEAALRTRNAKPVVRKRAAKRPAAASSEPALAASKQAKKAKAAPGPTPASARKTSANVDLKPAPLAEKAGSPGTAKAPAPSARTDALSPPPAPPAPAKHATSKPRTAHRPAR